MLADLVVAVLQIRHHMVRVSGVSMACQKRNGDTSDQDRTRDFTL